MPDHKVKRQSAFARGRTVFSRRVTLTCSCGQEFSGHYTGKRDDDGRVLEMRALENAEALFRAHIPIR